MKSIIAIKFSEKCPVWKGWVKDFADTPIKNQKVVFDKVNDRLVFSLINFGTKHQGGIGATLSTEIPDEWVDDLLEVLT